MQSSCIKRSVVPNLFSHNHCKWSAKVVTVSILLFSVQPVLSGAVLSGHPELRVQLSKSRMFFLLITLSGHPLITVNGHPLQGPNGLFILSSTYIDW